MVLKAKAEKALLAEARRHREWQLLKTCPGHGPIRTAELLAGRGDPLPVPEPQPLLGVLGAWDRDAELVGLGAHADGTVGEGGGRADAGSEPETSTTR